MKKSSSRKSIDQSSSKCLKKDQKYNFDLNGEIRSNYSQKFLRKSSQSNRSFASQVFQQKEKTSNFHNEKSNPQQRFFKNEDRKKTNLSKFQELNLQKIIQDNFKYYQQKTKVCCSVKPPKQKLNFPTKTGSSTYKADYKKKSKINQKEFFSKQFEYKPNHAFNSSTTYQQNFVPHQNIIKEKTKEMSPDENLKCEDAPRYLTTQYKGQFKPWVVRSVQKLKPHQSNIFQTGAFDGRTNYSTNYQGKLNKSSVDKRNYQQDNNIFRGVNIPLVSQYQSQFRSRPFQNNSPKLQKYQSSPSLSLPGQFRTEYNSSYVPKEMQHHCLYSKSYTKEQITDLLLKI